MIKADYSLSYSRNTRASDRVSGIRTTARAAAVIWICTQFLASCLLFYPDVTIEPIAAQTAVSGTEFSVALSAESNGLNLTYTYTIDGSGWVAIDGSTFVYTFTEPGVYEVEITASNGLKSASTAFTVTVN